MINSVREGLMYLVLVCSGLCLAQGQSSDWAVPDSELSITSTDAPSSPAAEEQGTATQQQRRGRGRGMGRAMEGVYRARVTAHWFAGNTRFWYRNDLRGQTKEFVLVDAEKGTRGLAFDHAKLAAALSKAAREEYKADQLPFSDIEFVEDGKAIKVIAGGKTWRCDLATYACSVQAADANTPAATDQGDAQAGPAGMRGRGRGRGAARGGDPNRPLQSPDGRLAAYVKDRNVCVRTEPNGPEVPLTQDGQEGNAYGRLEWSPDSTVLVAWRIEPGERKEVYRIRSSPAGGGRATFIASPYALPGDKFTLHELNLFEVASRKQTKPQVDRFEHEWLSPELHWDREGRCLSYRQVDRGHQRFRVIQVDKQTGAVRNLVDEKTETFIWTAHMEGPERLGVQIVTWLEKSDDLIYASERDGWRHLYLVDGHGVGIRNQITRGPWVVRGIDRIDEDNRQIEFLASGMNPGQDPYFLHAYRVNLDGTGLKALTEGNGNHSVEYSPDRRYLIDTYSRVDMAPVNELRRASDGRLVCRLEEADITELKAKGWTPPEVFVAKGRDGKTDIWGLIHRPADLDPAKKYPILEDLYAGPQDSFTPKTFGPVRYDALTRLGFIVVKMDGMGTANRSKAFHDVCWKNLKDAGFPDRIAWMKAAAAKYPYMDITRVGVYGGSAGGQSAAGAVLFHPEFYKAAAANCGCHDNRMDKASWNEQWMGYPVGPHYAECSNIENAAKLQGHLFLSVGEVDDNVPPESTMRFVDALIRANKDFDLLVVPNGGHGAGGNYYQRRMQDFFVRHLLGIEPPNRNATAPNEPQVNTFSIVGFDPASGDLGIAVASKVLGVGSIVPWAKAKVGAIATQSVANTAYGPEGLALLTSGKTAKEVVGLLTQADPGRDDRQVGVVDTNGSAASFTGPKCNPWAGHIEGDHFAVQGNLLTGEEVLKAMAAAYEKTRKVDRTELADWLMAALKAGESAGGDRRGRQSASLMVVRDKAGYGGNDRYIDLRVEDHAEPVTELVRLLDVHKQVFAGSHKDRPRRESR